MQALGSGTQVAFGIGSAAETTAGFVGGFLVLVALLWHAALWVVGAALARRIGYGEAAGSCALSFAGCLALIILVAVVVVGAVVLIGAAASQ